MVIDNLLRIDDLSFDSYRLALSVCHFVPHNLILVHCLFQLFHAYFIYTSCIIAYCSYSQYL